MRLRFVCLLASAMVAVAGIAGCGNSSSSSGGGGNGGGGTGTSPLSVTSVTPASGATGVDTSTLITATFSEAMNSSSLTASTFTLASSSGSVAGSVTYSSNSNTATFTPSAPLAYSTAYTATITTGAAASSGTALAQNDSWNFTTGAAPAPTVTAETPASGATGVSLGTTVTATFSEAMNPSTFTASTFTVTDSGGNPVAGTVSYSTTGNTATFTPSADLVYATTYTATISTAATSSAGAALASAVTWSFTTVTAPAGPTVTATTPVTAATGVAVSTTLTATFNVAMSPTTIGAATFTLSGGGSSVAGSVAYNTSTDTATFIPSAALSSGTLYTATITTGAMSASGQPLAANYTWQFTTAPAPTVQATTPASGATGVSLNSVVTATFSESMSATTLTTSTFTLSSTNGNVTGTVTYSPGSSTATFTPSAALTTGTVYTATVTTGAQNNGGGALAANYTWSFTTEATSSGMVTVDYGTQEQLIRGFGASTAWLGTMPPRVATALFSPTGLNLSILRVRIDPEGSASGGGTSGYPYETQQWDEEAANGKEAVQNNPNALVFASPWTPPAAWKLNGSSSVSDDGETWNQSFNTCSEGTGYCGGYLDPSHYADYADFLEDFVHFFNSVNSFNLYAISMQNEPEENVTYESCVWTPEEMDAWIANNASTITSDAYSTKLIMPESNSFNPIDAAAALSDANAQGLISVLGGHIYQVLFGGSIAPYSIPSGDSPKELWMTEFGPLSSATPTWAQALSPYAESIHNALVTGQYNAYVWWGAFGYSAGNCATSAGTCGLVDNAGNVTVMGDVMGQYSKFIQPGYYRYNATATPYSNVFVSAYSGSESGTTHYVIVAINANTQAISQPFTIENATVTSMTAWQTTSTAGLVQQSTPVSVSGNAFTYTLPPQSITTFVQ